MSLNTVEIVAIVVVCVLGAIAALKYILNR